MTLLRESLVAPAPNEASRAISTPVDPLTKSRRVIEATPGLDDGEKDGVFKSVEELAEHATVTQYLPIFAGRIADEAVKTKTKSQQGATPVIETPVNALTLPLRRTVWHRPGNGGRRARHLIGR